MDPFEVGLAIGGAMVIAGSLLSWNRFVVGILAFHGKSGPHAPGVLLLGLFMVFRGVSLARGTNVGGFGGRGPALFVGPVLVVVLLVQYAVTVKSHLIQWVLGPESAAIGRLLNLPSGEVLPRLRSTIDSGDVHLTHAGVRFLAGCGGGRGRAHRGRRSGVSANAFGTSAAPLRLPAPLSIPARAARR